MKNKILSLLIIFSLTVIGFSPFYYKTEAADYSESIRLMECLGLTDKNEASRLSGEYITRGLFAEKLFSLYNMDYIGSSHDEKYFYDISFDSSLFVCVMFLYDNDIMRGYADGSFKPDYYITGTEAVVSFVNLLGYSYKAAALGGYPSGYIAVAKSIGLLEGINLDYSYKLNGGELAKLIDNALTIPVVELTATGKEDIYKISQDNILGIYFDMSRETGVIIANEYISISGDIAPENCITLNGKQLYYSDYSYMDYVGKNVTAVYENSDDKINNLIYISLSSRDNSKVFNIKDYISSSADEFVFEQNEKNIRIKTGVDAKIFYNNSGLTLSEKLPDFIKKISDGEIRFVSTGENGKYDIIFITGYKYLVADRINPGKHIVTDKADKNEFVELDNEKYKVIITDKNQKEINFSDIHEGNVLKVIENSKYKRVVVSENIISGILESKISDGKYVVYSMAGDRKYKIASERETLYDKMIAGSNLKLYLDENDEIIFAEKTNADGYMTAYLIKAVSRIRDNEEAIIGKFFDVYGNLNKYIFKKGFKINGESTDKNMTKDEFATVLQSYNDNIGQLVLFKINEEKEIDSIILARSKDILLAGNDDGLCLQHPSKILTFLSGPYSFSHKIHVGSLSTPVLIIPKDFENADDKDFKVVDYTYLQNGQKAYVESYSYSKYSLEDDVVVMFSDDSIQSEIDEYVYAYVVTSKSKVINEDGAEVTRIKVTDGEKESYFDVEQDCEIKTTAVFGDVSGEYSPFDLSKGDVIRYVADSKNNLQNFEFYYDADKDAFYEKNKKELIGNGMIMRNVEEIDSKWIAFLHGSFSLTPTDYIKFNLTNKQITRHVILTEKAHGEFIVSNITSKEIMPGDKAIALIAGNILYSLVIVR